MMSKTIMMNYTRQPLSVMKRYIRIWQSAICLMPMNVLPLKRNLMMIFQYYRKPVRKRKPKVMPVK